MHCQRPWSSQPASLDDFIGETDCSSPSISRSKDRKSIWCRRNLENRILCTKNRERFYYELLFGEINATMIRWSAPGIVRWFLARNRSGGQGIAAANTRTTVRGGPVTLSRRTELGQATAHPTCASRKWNCASNYGRIRSYRRIKNCTGAEFSSTVSSGLLTRLTPLI